jgi:hypothetical protein
VRLTVLSVGFLHVAVDVSIGDRPAAGLARLTAAMMVSLLAVNLAAVLAMLRGDRPKARLGLHVGRFRRLPRRSVDLNMGVI